MAAIENSERLSSDGTDQEAPSSSAGAKYKLLSPAKLPISRSACLTIPPGLSPSSFLESPVMLSNMKAEPSPTTGTFFNQMVQSSVGSAMYSSTTVCSNISTSGMMNSSSFEFKPHGSLNMALADPNNYHMSSQVHGQSSQPFASNPSVKSESSNELSLSAPVSVVASGNSGPAADGDSEELSQRGNLNPGAQSAQFDQKVSGPSVVSSDDGYNWRKYGQKHVKGSEFPRSYYKCTHPNCEVKKLFERSHDGQITEIIYKGTHDHPKPQPSRRYNTGTIIPIQDERSDKYSCVAGRDDKSPNIYGQTSNPNDPNGTPDMSPIANNDDGAEANRINDEMDEDDPFTKRRKMEMGGIDITPVVKPIREPRVVVQTLSEVDILDDGYRWRKYGQKVVRGNPNPRSYYKCTNNGCPVRKHVERASHDPKAVITTYEGKHNHDVPTARNTSHEMAGPPRHMRPEEPASADTISLDLGVGISNSASDNRPNNNDRIQIGRPDHQNNHHGMNMNMNMNMNMIHHQTQVPPGFYGMMNNPYGSRENIGDGRGGGGNPPSYPYPPNMGRIMMGP